MTLPADQHVHTQWSWDADRGDMAATCDRAVALGPPAVDRCRTAYPKLTILNGVEIGQPHLHPAEVEDLLTQGPFDRILGSLHCLPDGDAYTEPWALVPRRSAEAVVRARHPQDSSLMVR